LCDARLGPEDREQDQQLRAQALLALGLLNEQASETALIRLIADQHEDPILRGLAAEHLPEQLSSEGRRFLRDLLRNERPPAPIVIGSLQALGHVRDRESMPLMLRYGQDENAQIAQAAITALNGSDMGGRTLTVNEARPQEPRSGGGGGRGGFGGGGGGGRGPGGKRDRW